MPTPPTTEPAINATGMGGSSGTNINGYSINSETAVSFERRVISNKLIVLKQDGRTALCRSAEALGYFLPRNETLKAILAQSHSNKLQR